MEKITSFNQVLGNAGDSLRSVERDVNVEKRGLDDFRAKVSRGRVTRVDSEDVRAEVGAVSWDYEGAFRCLQEM